MGNWSPDPTCGTFTETSAATCSYLQKALVTQKTKLNGAVTTSNLSTFQAVLLQPLLLCVWLIPDDKHEQLSLISEQFHRKSHLLIRPSRHLQA